MYKVLVVDDEVFVRMGLKASVQWNINGFELIGEAGNGQQALEIMKANMPDIVITDIKMPVMDGISLIKEISVRYPAVKCLVLSNYDDFELVREAMKNGAADYFLKVTVEPEKLIGVLKEISLKIEKEIDSAKNNTELKWKLNQNQHVIKNRFIIDLLKSDINEEYIRQRADLLGLRFDSSNGLALLITVTDYQNEVKVRFGGDCALLSYAVSNLIDELINCNFKGDVFEIGQGDFVAVFSGEWQISREKEKKLAEQIKDSLVNYLGINANVFFGMRYNSYTGLRNRLSDIADIKLLGFYETGGMVLLYSEQVFTGENLSEVYAALKEDVGIYMKFRDYERVLQSADEFLLQAKASKCEPDVLKGMLISLLDFLDVYTQNAADFSQMNIVQQIHSTTCFEELSSFYLSLLNEFTKNLQENNSERYKNEILKAIEYVEKNYSIKITLEGIARNVSMNKSYFSRFFKKETGIAFQDYLTKVRMQKVSDLILNTDKKVIDIAMETGFSDIFYFNRVFKKYYNTSPSEYRKKMRGN